MNEKLIDTGVILSRQDEKAHNERGYEANAAKTVFDHAQLRYHNHLTELEETSSAFWDHLYEVYGLDATLRYKIEYNRSDRRHHIFSIEDES